MTIKDYNLFSTGKFYYQWGHNVIGIYPTPTEVKTIRIHYVGKLDDMVKGNDEPDKIMDEFHEALISYAVMQISKRLNVQLFPLFKAEWNELLDEVAMGSKVVREEIVQSSHKDI